MEADDIARSETMVALERYLAMCLAVNTARPVLGFLSSPDPFHFGEDWEDRHYSCLPVLYFKARYCVAVGSYPESEVILDGLLTKYNKIYREDPIRRTRAILPTLILLAKVHLCQGKCHTLKAIVRLVLLDAEGTSMPDDLLYILHRLELAAMVSELGPEEFAKANQDTREDRILTSLLERGKAAGFLAEDAGLILAILDGQLQHLCHGLNIHVDSVVRVLKRMEAIFPEFHASSLDEYSLATGAAKAMTSEYCRVGEVTRAEYWSVQSLIYSMHLERLRLRFGASEDVTRPPFQRATHNRNKIVHKTLSEYFNNCWPPLEYQQG